MARYVWRVENDRGEGPYNCDAMSAMNEKHCRDLLQWPAPRDERIPIRGYICGFRNRTLAKIWFRGHLKQLRRHGFKLKRVRASEINYGEKQVTFKRYEEKREETNYEYIPF